MNIPSSNNKECPWLGLSTYEEKDACKFYGRSREVGELYNDITHNVLTIIYGPSGIGKSSVINAGISRKLREEREFMVKVRLNHESGKSYVMQIIQCIGESLESIGGDIEERMTPVFTKDGNISLWEYLHTRVFWSKMNYPVLPLIVIDQFEEIFTFGKEKNNVPAFFEQLADVCDNRMPKELSKHLNEIGKCVEYPDHTHYRIVISMREDFLARLEEYSTEYPSFKHNRYSLQAINKKQAREIITKPCVGLVSDEVADKIIGKVSSRTGKSMNNETEIDPAILSIFCSELYKKMIEKNADSISMELVNEMGDNIIKRFYDDAMQDISAKSKEVLEDELVSHDGFRNFVSRSDLISDGVKEKDIEYLEKKKRLIRLSVLDGTIRVELTHDVLCKEVVDSRNKRVEEERNKKLAKKIRNQAFTFIILILVVIGGILLALYGFVFEYSEYYADIVKVDGWPTGSGEKLSGKERKNTHYYYKLLRTGRWKKPSINDITKILKLQSRYGFSFREKKFERVEIRHVFGQLATVSEASEFLNPRNESGYYTTAFPQRFKNVSCWEYIPDVFGNVAQEVAFDIDGSVAYVCSFYKASETEKEREKERRERADATNAAGFDEEEWNVEQGDIPNIIIFSAPAFKNVYWGMFTDGKGITLKLNKNGADRIKITRDNQGYEKQHMYYDTQGRPQMNESGIFGKRWLINKNKKDSICWYIDKYGDYMAGNRGYDHICYRYCKESGKWSNIDYLGLYNQIVFSDSISYDSKQYIVTSKKNENMIEVKTIVISDDISIHHAYNGVQNQNDTLVVKEISKYNKAGKLLSMEKLNQAGELAIREDGFSKIKYEYDESGNMVLQEYLRGKNNKEQVVVRHVSSFYDDFGRNNLNYRYDIERARGKAKGFFEKIQYDSIGQLSFRGFYYSKGKKDLRKVNRDSIRLLIDSTAPRNIRGYHKYERMNISDAITTNQYFKFDTLSKNIIRIFSDESDFDMDGNLVRYTLWDSIRPNQGSRRFAYEYDAFGSEISRAKIGRSGYPVRDTSNLMSYKQKTIINFKGQVYIKAINEFGEPTYLDDVRNKDSLYLEINPDDTIKIARNNRPQAVMLHVPWRGYKPNHEIRDGDVLIGYGRWDFSFDDPKFYRLYSEIKRLWRKEKVITIVRHNPVTMKSEPLHVKIPQGGFAVDLMFIHYTEKEKARLQEFLTTKQ